MSLLADLQRDGALRVVDHALAQSLRRLDPAAPELVLAGAALASCAVGHGHAAFDPERPALLCDADIDWPAPDAWAAAFAQSHWVATPALDASADPATPLVFEDGLLYLRRYREYEFHLAAHLRRIAAQAPAPSGLDAIAPLFARLFPDARAGDAQAWAAALALQRALLLVTGGPGTGKTATIARVLALLVAQAQAHGAPAPRMALAAPTGRAAERMAESVHHAAAQLRATGGLDAAIGDALPTEAKTLHRLLGTIPGSPRFRHDADNPLPFDVVVVDEASMIDLPLMCKLAQAIADGTRLILLGDRDQLPSIEAGDVLAAICDAATRATALGHTASTHADSARLPADVAAALAPLLGDVAIATDAGSALAGHRVHLQRGYRQSEALDLAPLARAVRDGDADTTLALLRGGTLCGVQFHEDLHDPICGPTRAPLLDAWRAIATASDPVRALALAARVRLLTALRDGPQGAQLLNARIEEALAGAQHPAYFHGRLLLVQENDYRQQLFNGDLGVCLRDADGDIAVWFADGAGARRLHPSALPAHGGAFAMTVHKAQGSEFDQVWLQLPRHDARTLSRELLYTAVTRARAGLHICASEVVVRATLARHAQRVSGLARRL